MDNVIIIGGGITGMAAAYYLQQEAAGAGRQVNYTLLQDGNLGGKIVTERADGFLVEGGPDCFIAQKPWAADLCRSLGIGDQLMGTNDERRKVFVLDRGRLAPLPDGVMLIVPTRVSPFLASTLISWPGKIRMGMDWFIPARRDGADESIGDFVRRRLGREALDKIAEPLLSGIHVSDPEKQSLLGTFPRFRDLEVKHGSLIRGMLAGRRQRAASHGGNNGNGTGARPSSLFITLRGGLGQMVSTLAGALEGEIHAGTRAERIETLPGGGYRVWTDDGRAIDGQAVVLATPAHAAARLAEPLGAQLAAELARIRYVSTATVSLGYRAGEAGALNGFGFVVPRHEGRRISACTWTSTKFDDRAPEGHVLLRCFIGGPGHEEQVEMADDQILRTVREELATTMGLRAEPVMARIYRWRQANPQYDVGHLERMQTLRDRSAEHPGLFIAGSAYDGVGVPDCVRQGKEAAHRAITYLCSPEQGC